LIRATFMLLLFAAVSACTSVASTRHGRHVAQPGFYCEVGRRFETGAWASATLDSNGQQLKAEWDWRQSLSTPLLRVSAVGSVKGPNPPNPYDAYTSVSWAQPGKRKSPKLRLELTTAPDSRYWWARGFTTDFTSDLDRSLVMVWSDLIALSRGASSLDVVLRAPNGRVAKKASVDPMLIASGERQVSEALHSLADLTRDYTRRCQRVDDVDPKIIVT